MAPSSSTRVNHAIHDFANDVTAQAEGFAQSTDIAEESIARDLEEDNSESQEDDDEDGESSGSSTVRQYSMINSYRRPSYVNPGARSTAFGPSSVPERSYMSTSAKKHSHLSKKEREAVRDEERSLLRDNNLLPPKHPRSGSASFPRPRISFPSLRKMHSAHDEEEAVIESEPSEQSALLGVSNRPYDGLDTSKTINQTWSEAVAAGKINTTWQREAKVLTKSSAPMILTFLLQYSLPVASIFTVGHIGKTELGAVSLASSKLFSLLPLSPGQRPFRNSPMVFEYMMGRHARKHVLVLFLQSCGFLTYELKTLH